jgi:thiamine biosynthesis protein ThiS
MGISPYSRPLPRLFSHSRLKIAREDDVQILLNGEPMTIAGGTVTELLRLLGIESERVAVELNLEILPKARYGTTALSDGDRIEIVHFVGGG